jgi:hypothetical protein
MTPNDEKSTKRWRLAGTGAAVLATAAVAGGAAWATDLGSLTGTADPTPSPSASPSTSPSQGTNEDEKEGRPFKHGMFGFGPSLHGEFTVEKEDGGYQTVATQTGEVTAVSTDSITVKSEDGYSRTYAVTEDTMVNAARDGIGDIKNGDTVHVMATVADGKATAVNVNDNTVRKGIRDKLGLGRGPR